MSIICYLILFVFNLMRSELSEHMLVRTAYIQLALF